LRYTSCMRGRSRCVMGGRRSWSQRRVLRKYARGMSAICFDARSTDASHLQHRREVGYAAALRASVHPTDAEVKRREVE
jgi:hypothetical protein